MIIFLYGPDEYRRLKKKQLLLAEFRKKHSGLAIRAFDCAGEGVPAALHDFLGNQSIFDPVRLAVLEGALEDPSKELAEDIRSMVGRSDTTLLISEKDAPNKAFRFLLKKPVLFQKFEHLEGVQWRTFIKQEAAQNGVALDEAALVFFARVYANDTWRLATELAKIGSLGKSTIQKADLVALDVELRPDFWQLVTGLRSWNTEERLAILEKLFSIGEPAGKIFNILAYQQPEKLATFAAYDTAIKSGKLDYEEALLDFAIS